MNEIRDASIPEVEIIQDIAQRTWWPVYSPILSKGQIEYMLSTMYSTPAIQGAMQDGSQTFIILYEDGIPKGFAAYGAWKEDSNNWKISKLYVLPDEHGKGLGRMLLDEIRNRAAQNKLEKLILNVNRYNPAVNFYKRYGFDILREEDGPIGPYVMNDYVMQLPV
jgi:ribosomal protein S18 acetylase RimI-like enzyme